MNFSVPQYLMLAMALPFVGFLALLFFGRRIGKLAGPISTALLMGSLGLSIAALVAWVAKDAFNQPHYVESVTHRWIPLAQGAANGTAPLLPGPNNFTDASPNPAAASAISVGYFVDSLTVAMFVMVTVIGSLVHLFSISFMAGDANRPRFFAYLGLFCSAMMGVILSNSLVQLFACWSVAGLAAYLLVGFWFDRRGPATGALKMMLLAAIGDVSLLMGIGILAAHVGAAGLVFYDTSSMSDALTRAVGVNAKEFLYFSGGGTDSFLGLHWLTWAGLLMFGGAVAKAAQFPLHTWLPEAMEAPPPAIALVHGSMVLAAGVYLVARLYPILTVDAHLVIAIVGCITLLVGALIAIVQTDLKRLLAFSAMSQAGYMMLFMGAGAYTAGLVHLFTQAFVSACLFLAAASVIHALKGTSELRQMGGLWKRLPLTAVAMALASLALIGVPFFSGGYSRNLGLAGVYEYAHALAFPRHERAAMWLFYLPAMVTFVTAFYTARGWWLVFGGKSRNEDLAEQAHESFLMILPVGILAAMSFNFYEFFLLPSLVTKSLADVNVGGARIVRATEQAREILKVRSGAYAAWGFLGALPALVIYSAGLGFADRLRRLPALNLLHAWLRERMFFDAIYQGILLRVAILASATASIIDRYIINGLLYAIRMGSRAISQLTANIDSHFVDGAAMGLAGLTRLGAKGVAAGQLTGGGRIRTYLLLMICGIALLAATMLWLAWHT